MPKPTLISVNAGRPAELHTGRRALRSAIVKRPVEGPVRLRAGGLDGDEQADRENHGGPYKAAYAYAREDQAPGGPGELGRDVPPALFGETLSTDGLDVNGAEIGERWRIGAAEVTVSGPRVPCQQAPPRASATRCSSGVSRTPAVPAPTSRSSPRATCARATRSRCSSVRPRGQRRDVVHDRAARARPAGRARARAAVVQPGARRLPGLPPGQLGPLNALGQPPLLVELVEVRGERDGRRQAQDRRARRPRRGRAARRPCAARRRARRPARRSRSRRCARYSPSFAAGSSTSGPVARADQRRAERAQALERGQIAAQRARVGRDEDAALPEHRVAGEARAPATKARWSGAWPGSRRRQRAEGVAVAEAHVARSQPRRPPARAARSRSATAPGVVRVVVGERDAADPAALLRAVEHDLRDVLERRARVHDPAWIAPTSHVFVPDSVNGAGVLGGALCLAHCGARPAADTPDESCRARCPPGIASARWTPPSSTSRRPQAPLHVGWTIRFDGRPPSLAALRRHLDGAPGARAALPPARACARLLGDAHWADDRCLRHRPPRPRDGGARARRCG